MSDQIKINEHISISVAGVPTFLTEVARYVQYLENQHECIGNRDDMASKKWWDNSPMHCQSGLLQAIYACTGGPAEDWEPMKEEVDS